MILGSTCGVIGGLLLEHCGIRRTGCVALSVVLSYASLFITLHYPDSFNGSLYPMLIVLFAINGEYLGLEILFVKKLIQHGNRAFLIHVLVHLSKCTPWLLRPLHTEPKGMRKRKRSKNNWKRWKGNLKHQRKILLSLWCERTLRVIQALLTYQLNTFRFFQAWH